METKLVVIPNCMAKWKADHACPTPASDTLTCCCEPPFRWAYSWLATPVLQQTKHSCVIIVTSFLECRTVIFGNCSHTRYMWSRLCASGHHVACEGQLKVHITWIIIVYRFTSFPTRRKSDVWNKWLQISRTADPKCRHKLLEPSKSTSVLSTLCSHHRFDLWNHWISETNDAIS